MHSEKELTQAINQGPITAEYKADPKRIVSELNRLRATELTSYLQYKQHAYMAVSMFAPGLKDDFQAHADVELQHADLLGERVQQLGGVPVYSPVELAAKALGKQTRVIDTGDDEDVTGVFPATWVLVTGNPRFFDKPEFRGSQPKLIAQDGLRTWTDDYSNLFRILK